MKKCFIILQFGKPHEWTQKYIDHVQHLGQYGWDFQIYTPNDFESKGNVQIIKMTIEEYNVLVEKKLGVKPTVYITPAGIPSMHMTDHLIFLGAIFEDYLKDYDFWGTIGLDCVVGRLDHFVTDEMLENSDVWTDDIGQFNANFGLWRNTPEITNIFKRIKNWQEAFADYACPGCLGTGEHMLLIIDEIAMSVVLEKLSGTIRYNHPKYFLIHSYDRIENHLPLPKLAIMDDGSLWELLADVHPTRHPFMGREIAYYHFSGRKSWPTIQR